MRRINFLATLATLLMAFVFSSALYAQDSTMAQKKNQFKKELKQNKAQSKAQKGVSGFVDENGDGYNDNAPDADGDGIPNGQDEDYEGPKLRKGNAKGFIDADGDGVNDNAMDDDGDGIPNGQDDDYVRPEDGSGRQNKLNNGKGKKSNNAGAATSNGKK